MLQFWGFVLYIRGCHENSDPENSDLRPRKLRPRKLRPLEI